MISDCIHNSTDSIVLVSADTDLIPPLELIKQDFSDRKIKVMFPPSNYSHDIADTIKSWKSKLILMQNNYKRFENAVMPDIVTDKVKTYKIPGEWKEKQGN